MDWNYRKQQVVLMAINPQPVTSHVPQSSVFNPLLLFVNEIPPTACIQPSDDDTSQNNHSSGIWNLIFLNASTFTLAQPSTMVLTINSQLNIYTYWHNYNLGIVFDDQFKFHNHTFPHHQKKKKKHSSNCQS